MQHKFIDKQGKIDLREGDCAIIFGNKGELIEILPKMGNNPFIKIIKLLMILIKEGDKDFVKLMERKMEKHFPLKN